MLTSFVIVSWWVVGASGFVFWWTKDCDFTLGEIFVGCLAGIAGPIFWVFVIKEEAGGFMSKVIIKKRDSSENGVGE